AWMRTGSLSQCRDERFFFSSRRRHTRSKRDWSSDVCSSDLDAFFPVAESNLVLRQIRSEGFLIGNTAAFVRYSQHFSSGRLSSAVFSLTAPGAVSHKQGGHSDNRGQDYRQHHRGGHKTFIFKIISQIKFQYGKKLLHASSPALSTKISFKEGS